MTTSSRAPALDVTDPAVLHDPYPAYARLRQVEGLAPGGPGQWLAARHDDVAALLKDQRLTKNLPESYYRFSVGDPEISGFLAGMNLGHRNRLASRLMVKAFSPGLVRSLGDAMERLVDRHLDELIGAGRVDAVGSLAIPFPLQVICELLGVPDGERARVGAEAAELVRAFSDVAFLSAKDVLAAGDSLRWLRRYFAGLLPGRRAVPGPDLVSRLLGAEEAGERLHDAEIVDQVITVFYAGFETSAAMVSNGLLALIEHPDQMRRLRADPGLVPAAVEEIFRFEAPIQVTMRSPLEKITVAGQVVRPGRVIYLLIGSANRDGRVFHDPDRLDVGRRPNPHLSFGAGVYHCLGAALARVEGAVLFRRLLERTSAIELAGPAVRRPRFNFRALEQLPLTLTAGPGR